MFHRKIMNGVKYISITELARLLDMTTETLRYYDRIDLFKPDIKGDNKYRYYDILRFDLLGTIKQLRQLGMSIEDVKKYYEDKNLEKSYAMLSELYEELDSRVKELNALKKILYKKIDLLQQYVEENAFYEGAKRKHFKERKIITKGELVQDTVLYAEETIFLESLLTEVAPMLGANREGGVIPFTEENIGRDCGPWIPFIFVDSFKGIEKTYCQKMPEGDYVCAMYHDYYLRLENDAIHSIIRYCEENDFEIIGDIIACDVLDVTVTDHISEMVIELQAPVRKKRN